MGMDRVNELHHFISVKCLRTWGLTQASPMRYANTIAASLLQPLWSPGEMLRLLDGLNTVPDASVTNSI
jgi:hypothetical protein